MSDNTYKNMSDDDLRILAMQIPGKSWEAREYALSELQKRTDDKINKNIQIQRQVKNIALITLLITLSYFIIQLLQLFHFFN